MNSYWQNKAEDNINQFSHTDLQLRFFIGRKLHWMERESKYSDRDKAVELNERIVKLKSGGQAGLEREVNSLLNLLLDSLEGRWVTELRDLWYLTQVYDAQRTE